MTVTLTPGSSLDTTSGLRRRVCVLSEDLSGAPDEGVKKFTLALADALARNHEVALLSTRGPVTAAGAAVVPAPRTFLSRPLRAALARRRPEVLIYAARSSATLLAFLRCRVLRAYCPRATVVLVSLQARRHPRWQRRAIRSLAPDLICAQSPASRDYLAGLGCGVALLPSGVDVETFRPVEAARRRELRARYGLRADRPVALHVGHLQPGRGIRALADLAARGACQVVLVTSSSTAYEAAAGLAEELRAAGVVVLTDYLPHVEHLYQLADCYVFPVASTDNAIEVPLSVLEALACDLPVATTRFGGLPRLFDQAAHPGLVFADTPAALVDAAERLCRTAPAGTRELVLPYSWGAVAAGVLDQALRHREGLRV
ncbi:MAG TPA: glycosyltransferase family 4 protein [Thermomicrobiales bacterium]|nr:glycosyltransferase family 4 protein [Thermomicrobiales bacterium]